jgi:endonuclease YncB( thermonuclease family)
MLRCLIIATLSLLLPLPAAAAELRGIAKVVDGDTLRIEGIPVRLDSIDAPETDQLCQREGRRGSAATDQQKLCACSRRGAKWSASRTAPTGTGASSPSAGQASLTRSPG